MYYHYYYYYYYYCIPSCIIRRPLPTYQISLKFKKLFVDGRADIWDPRRSRPKNRVAQKKRSRQRSVEAVRKEEVKLRGLGLKWRATFKKRKLQVKVQTMSPPVASQCLPGGRKKKKNTCVNDKITSKFPTNHRHLTGVTNYHIGHPLVHYEAPRNLLQLPKKRQS